MFCKRVPARFVLWIMTFLSYTLQYVHISNLNIAIPAMISRHQNVTPAAGHNSSPTNVDNGHNCTKPSSLQDKFVWNETEEALILGAVYWLMWAAHLIGGTVSFMFGSKLVIGYSILFGSGLSLIIPISAIIHYRLLMLVRIVQGFIVGLAFPSIMAVVPYWVPEHERGKFLTSFLGINLGSAIANFLGGVVIKTLNWESFFYATGVIGIVWCFFWNYLMFDRPDQHPRISNDELAYLSSVIRSTPSKSSKRSHRPIPWSRILTSGMVISDALIQFGILWSLTALIIYAPTYIQLFYNLNILTVGLATGVPYLVRVPLSIAYSALADKLIKNKSVSATNIRKLSTFISNILPGIAFFALVIYGEYLWVVLVCMGLAIILSGACISGSVCALVDISPTYGGVLQGLAGALGITSGFLIPLLVGYLTLNNNTIDQWRIFFSISGLICIASGSLFLVVWNSEVKEWDHDAEIAEEAPRKPLKNSTYATENSLTIGV